VYSGIDNRIYGHWPAREDEYCGPVPLERGSGLGPDLFDWREEQERMRRRLGIAALGLAVLVLAGCTSAEQAPLQEEGEIVRDTLSADAPGTDFPITIEDVEPGDRIGVDFRGSVMSGTVTLQFRGPQGDVVWEEQVESIGPFVVNEVVTATSAVSHQLGLAWDEGVDISYALGWQPGEFEQPAVEPIALLRGIGLVALAVAVVVYTGVRRLGWKHLGLGALVWVGVFVLKFVVAGAVNYYVGQGLSRAFSPDVATLVSYAYSGVMVGLFEVVAVYLLLRYSEMGNAPLESAKSFGLGFGGAESLASGLLLLWVSVLALTEPSEVPLVVPELAVLNNPLYGIPPILEQAGAILVHCFSLILLFHAVVTGRIRSVVLSFGYKFAYVVLVSLGSGIGDSSLLAFWAVASGVALWGGLGLLGCRSTAERYPKV
jgi:hypothetical protein